MKQIKSIFHIMIVWSKADNHKDYIIDELKKNFSIVKIFMVHWDRLKFKQNLSVFYSHSLKDFSNEEMNRILEDKKRNVGDGPFYAVVFEDKAPVFEERETTSGTRLVNAHVFDIKKVFRQVTDGYSRIHCSDDSWETNKDLAILFGLNLSSFLHNYKYPFL